MFQSLIRRPATGPVEFLVVGLGNPGAKYDGTRHNVGFHALDMLADKYGAKVDRIKYKGLCGDCMIGAHRVLLLKPSTFMNLSGESVREAMQFYKIPPQKVLLLFDDVSLEPGCMRIRLKGSDGGHNGVKSILYLTGSDQFPRIKIGVGAKPHPDYDLADWVLGRFSKEDADKVRAVFDRIPQAAQLIIEGKESDAMNQFNR